MEDATGEGVKGECRKRGEVGEWRLNQAPVLEFFFESLCLGIKMLLSFGHEDPRFRGERWQEGRSNLLDSVISSDSFSLKSSYARVPYFGVAYSEHYSSHFYFSSASVLAYPLLYLTLGMFIFFSWVLYSRFLSISLTTNVTLYCLHECLTTCK